MTVRWLRSPVTIWVVRHGDNLYVRSWSGRTGAWFRSAQATHEGSGFRQTGFSEARLHTLAYLYGTGAYVRQREAFLRFHDRILGIVEKHLVRVL